MKFSKMLIFIITNDPTKFHISGKFDLSVTTPVTVLRWKFIWTFFSNKLSHGRLVHVIKLDRLVLVLLLTFFVTWKQTKIFSHSIQGEICIRVRFAFPGFHVQWMNIRVKEVWNPAKNAFVNYVYSTGIQISIPVKFNRLTRTSHPHANAFIYFTELHT